MKVRFFAAGVGRPLRPALPFVLSLLFVATLAPAPVAAAPPADVCVPACTVIAVDNAFVTPATVVLSGSTVTWESTMVSRNAHTATDAALSCFHVTWAPGRSASVTFDVVEGVLYATTLGSPVGPRACAALADAGGVFVVPYVCIHHDNTMVGDLVVVAGPA